MSASSSALTKRKRTREIRTSEPLPEEQADLVVPRQEVDDEHAHDVRDEVDRANIRAAVGDARRNLYASVDRHDLDEAVDAAKEGRVQVREAERGDDDLALVRETVGYVVERREEREEPRLGVGERLVEPESGWKLD